MSKNELSLFSYEILGLVGQGGAGAHDLLRLARRGRMLDWAGESQYYTEPKRLAKLGGEDATRESIATLRDDIDDLAARLDEGEATAEQLPHRQKYLLLVIDFLRKYLELHLELIEEVEREFDAEPKRSAKA